MPLAATQRDPDTIIPSEERKIAYEIIYLQKLKTKNNTGLLINERKINSQTWRMNLWLPELGEGWKGGIWGVWD